MPALRTQLEDAVRSRLGGLLKVALGGEAAGYLEAVEVYQGPLEPTQGDMTQLARVVQGRACGALVTTGDGDYTVATADDHFADLEAPVEILVFSTNLRSDESKVRGDGVSSDPGIYQMIEDIRGRLWLYELGIEGVGFLRPAGERAVVRNGTHAIWRLTFAVEMDSEAVRAEDSADSYTSRRISVNNADDGAADPVLQGDDSIP